jgi:hypothetical protein
VLAVAAAATQGSSFNYFVPISIGIAILLGIVATSYRQTIHECPSGGGAYIVAKENLGTTPGLIAGASLLVDYVPISGIHRGVVCALQYAKSIASDKVQAVYVDFEEEATAQLKEKWQRWGAGVQLVVLPSPYRELTRPLLKHINRTAKENDDNLITVVLPEFIRARWWQHILHNQSSLLLKGSLLFKRGVIVTSVPYHLEH